MGKKDPRVGGYIENAQPFAKPILEHLRKVVHNACPEVEETMKWRFPHFDYKGMLCNMSAFKNHCTFGFWKGTLLKDDRKLLVKIGDTAMAHFGKITRISDLPDEAILKAYILEAVKLNDENIQTPKPATKKKNAKKELEIPAFMLDAIRQNPQALKTFEEFSYSNKKEYVEWITEAKTEKTRDKRLTTTVAWLSEGKVRNWKYL